MRKNTVAENRAIALERFNEEYIHDIDKARKIVNIYYRLAALEFRNCENDTESNQNKSWYKSDLEKESKMYERLTEMLKPYELYLKSAWIQSNIVKSVNEYGGTAVVLNTYFY